jgi:hypothetical protein
VRRVLLLDGAIVFVDTMFFAALTPLLPHYVRQARPVEGKRRRPRGDVPGGALVAAIPSGVAARGSASSRRPRRPDAAAATTIAFGLASRRGHSTRRASAGRLERVHVDGCARVARRGLAARARGQLIGSAFGAAIAARSSVP